MNDRLFPMLIHPTSGADSLDLDMCCPVCEGKHFREKSPTRYIRSASSFILIFTLEGYIIHVEDLTFFFSLLPPVWNGHFNAHHINHVHV